MNRTHRIWPHVNEIFKHADAVFESADEAFAEADRVFAEADRIFNNAPAQKIHIKSGPHTLRFEARSGRERWKLARKFFSMSCSLLFTGKTRLRFKNRQAP